MHDKRSSVLEKTQDHLDHLPSGKGRPEGRMPTSNGALQVQLNAPAPLPVAAKSATLRQCKSFNSKESTMMIFKAPKSHQNSKISGSKSNGALSTCNGNNKVDAKQLSLSGSDKVKSPSNYGILKSSSPSVINMESQKKSSKETSPKPNITSDIKSASSRMTHKARDTISPKPANLTHVKSLSLSLNADPERKLPPIKTSRISTKASSTKNTANLCPECKAEVEAGAVCFIGNDGRVSACTSRNAVRLCKNLKCANYNPDFVASLTAANAAPKKYLVSRRHSLPRSVVPNGKSGKAGPDKMDAQAMNQSNGGPVAALPQQEGDDPQSEEFDMKDELEEDVTSLEDLSGEVTETNGIASASPYGGRSNGHHRMRRRSFNVIETEAPLESVTLRKQMMQERKQAEEWMLDYAIEEALQKLAPSKESKVKALVEAFESITPQKEGDATTLAQDHRPEVPSTPNKIAIKA